jgi:hypothetical protein
LKFMEVIIYPTHDILNGNVKVPEGIRFRDLYSPPNRWCSAFQSDLELIDLIESFLHDDKLSTS